MRAALVIVLLLVVVPGAVFVWAGQHKVSESPVVTVGIAPSSHVAKCVYRNHRPVAGCGWTGYAPAPRLIAVQLLKLTSCIQAGSVLDCFLPNGHRCQLVIGRPIECGGGVVVSQPFTSDPQSGAITSGTITGTGYTTSP
jgi:hypothetical protein